MLGLYGIGRERLGQWRFTGKVCLQLWRWLFELPEEVPQGESRAGDGVFLNGESDVKPAAAVDAKCGESFPQPSRASEQIDYGDSGRIIGRRIGHGRTNTSLPGADILVLLFAAAAAPHG
jgi:hypothetical protein